MRGRYPTSIKSSQSAAPAALLALVRLLARQAARDFVLHTRPEPPGARKNPTRRTENDGRPGIFARG